MYVYIIPVYTIKESDTFFISCSQENNVIVNTDINMQHNSQDKHMH